MPTERPVAACQALVKTYATATEQVQALRGIDLSFRRGAVAAVVGASGSGKSSLLRLLAGLDLPTSGKVLVNGLNLAAMSPRRLREVRRSTVGFVFQRPSDNFVPYLTVDEHMRLAARAGGRGKGPGPDELLDALGIAHRRDHLPEELSGGEQQRAAFAQVLTAGTAIIVADEPTAELDSRSAEDLLTVIRSVSEHGVAFVIATHDAGVTRMADDVVELDHGRVKRDSLGSQQGIMIQAPALGHTAGGDPVAEVAGLTKTYRRGPEEVHALDGVSLHLEPGRMVGLMGRSGSGKTTLLNVLAGWERADAGSVAWLADPEARLAERRWHELAILPQKFGLIEELTVRENIEYPARLHGSLDAAGERVDGLLGALGLEELERRAPSETSVGQQQRTALARALVLRPRLLLADEPSGHQDAMWARGVFGCLRAAAADGTACLVATHNEEVSGYFDEVVRMANGRIEQGVEASPAGAAATSRSRRR
ncbi:MAG: ABC transporter ATP-binding protein [Gaiellaceae bacterium]